MPEFHFYVYIFLCIFKGSAYFLTRDRYGQCFVLKTNGGSELEGKQIPDLEFEDFYKTEQENCEAKEWKFNED